MEILAAILKAKKALHCEVETSISRELSQWRRDKEAWTCNRKGSVGPWMGADSFCVMVLWPSLRLQFC